MLTASQNVLGSLSKPHSGAFSGAPIEELSETSLDPFEAAMFGSLLDDDRLRGRLDRKEE